MAGAPAWRPHAGYKRSLWNASTSEALSPVGARPPRKFHAQATSFRAASTTFGQLAGLMDQQADLLQRAGTLMRDPLTAGGPSPHKQPRELE